MYNMQFHFNLPQFFETFRYLFYGMAGVFVVTALIMIAIKLLSLAFNKKENKQTDDSKGPDDQTEE